MTRKKHLQQEQDETEELKSRLAETEETLQAIRQYMVDAFVVNRADGVQVVTLNEAEIPYRMMVEAMNEGAVTLVPDGTIFYCNSRFGEMVQIECEKLVGTPIRELISPEGQAAFEELFKRAGQQRARGQSCLKRAGGECIPVQLSVYLLGQDQMSGIAIIATDLTERIQAEEKIRILASKLARAEQEERHRISQILHDDLQQRLFAIKAQLYFLNDPGGNNSLSPAAYIELEQIQESLSEAIAITRNLSIDISPIIMQGDGLTEAMAWLASRMQEQHGLQVDLQVKEDLRDVDSQTRVLIFQAVRELLFNIVKHANTSQATVTLEEVDSYARIIISDSGKGFDVEATLSDPQVAHGLLIIQDRLALIGGSMEVASHPGRGTRVVMEILLRRTSKESH
ncbi:MAG TPA: PAS domain S-box protein [Anaerolineales bacterium]|nr:PAS domain S-box protein [Anaerolineales bacterium]